VWKWLATVLCCSVGVVQVHYCAGSMAAFDVVGTAMQPWHEPITACSLCDFEQIMHSEHVSKDYLRNSSNL